MMAKGDHGVHAMFEMGSYRRGMMKSSALGNS